MVSVAWFEVKSPKRGAKLRLDASFFVIGRGERIPIFHDDPSISREHAAIVIKKTGVRVRDLGSKNGVLLNGSSIGKYAEVDVKPGDSLKVGATVLVLHEGEPPVAVEKPTEEEPPAPTSSDEEDDAEPAPAPSPAAAAPSAPMTAQEKPPESEAAPTVVTE
jgi:DNA segregation ATPase FtsK/SpoIIIE, S-DNA-T family